MSMLSTISPVTSKPIIQTPVTSIESIDEILARSVASQSQWYSKTDLAERKSIVEAYVKCLEDPQTSERLGKELTEQMGRPISYTAGEVTTAAMRAKVLLSYADEALADVVVDKESQPQFKKYLSREPVGVVLIIFPWNYPYLCLTNALIPALLAGNSVIIKPSPQTPKVADAVLSLFEKAGLPEGVLQVVQSGDPKFVESMIARKELTAVSFTGSVAGGLAVQKAAANSGRTIPVALELGGNDPAYVRADIPGDKITAIAEDIVDGAIFNSGQSCCSIERVYVDSKIYEPFVDAVVKCVKSYRVGDPFDKTTQIGPVISETAARSIRSHIKDAIDRGARALIPKNVFAAAESINSTFVGPQVLVDLDPKSLVLTDESFGPVIPIVPVNGDEEAIALMNDTDFGLTASVWTSDLEKGEQIGDLIDAGTVFVNRSDYPDPHLAWTGYKNSGRGVSLSKYGFEFSTKLKSHHIKALA